MNVKTTAKREHTTLSHIASCMFEITLCLGRAEAIAVSERMHQKVENKEDITYDTHYNKSYSSANTINK